MSSVQACEQSPSLTRRLFATCVLTLAATKGAISATVPPCSHLSLQNRACSPFPIRQWTRLRKASATCLSAVRFKPCQGLDGSVLLSHSHLSLRAMPCLCRSMMPRPPSCLGRQTLLHETTHLLPLMASVPAQKNARQLLSTCQPRKMRAFNSF